MEHFSTESFSPEQEAPTTSNKEVAPKHEEGYDKNIDEIEAIPIEVFQRLSIQYLQERSVHKEMLNMLASKLVSSVEEDEDLVQENYTEVLEQYFSPWTTGYENGDFMQKLRTLEFFSLVYSKSFFAGAYVLQNEAQKKVHTLLKQESIDEGNHFLYLHLTTLLKSGDRAMNAKDTLTAIAPHQFMVEKDGSFFVSRIEDKSHIVELFEKQKSAKMVQADAYKKLVEEMTIQSDTGDTSVSIDFNSDDPSIRAYQATVATADSINAQYESYFLEPLESKNVRFQESVATNLSSSLLEYDFFTKKSIRDSFIEESGLDLSLLTLQEQFYFFEFCKTITNAEAHALYEFVRIYGVEGVKPFLSMEEEGSQFGKEILTIGSSMSIEDAKKVFTQYSKIIDTTKSVTAFIFEKYSKNNPSSSTVLKIEGTLLEKGTNLLRDISHMRTGVSQEGTAQKVIDLLAQYEENILLFASTFKILSEEQNDVSLEDIIGTKIQKFTKEDIARYTSDILEINRENRKGFLSETELEKRSARLLETLQSDTIEFYGAFFEGKIVSFVSFEPQPDGALLAESLNVAPSIKQSHIGNAFFETLIRDLGKEKDIYGYVHKNNADKLSFYEKMGFSISPIVKDDGSEWYMIRYATTTDQFKMAA